MKQDTTVTLAEVNAYWSEKNIPQQWYSKRERLSLPWFNELAYERYHTYFPWLLWDMEFEWHAGEEVLEVGCGIGTDLAQYAKHGAIVTGVDLGEDQIKLTKLNFETQGLPYKELRTANAEKLPFPDNSFDFVYSLGVIHHTPDIDACIREIHRVLKPDGKAIISIYARGWKHYIKRCFVHGILKGRWFAHGFRWQKVYNEVSEVHGDAPLTGVYAKRHIKKLFKIFPHMECWRRRMGEFFEYRPYRTVKFPDFVNNFLTLFALDKLWGENWVIKVRKVPVSKEESFWGVWFKHY